MHGIFPGPVDTDMTSEFDGAKTQPAEVAGRVLDGIEAGTEDIFPDPVAAQIEPFWTAGGKEVEKMFMRGLDV